MIEPVPWNEYVNLEPGPHLAQLAGFVDESLVAAAGMTLDHARTAEFGPGRRADVAELFKLLVAANIGYRREALDELGDQAVRSWSRFAREGATCLDLALVTCAQLLAADLRPHLVIDYGRTGHAGSGQTNHALVLVDLETPRTASAGRRPGGRTWRDGPAAPWLPAQLDDDSWVLFDPTEVCTLTGQDLDRAEALAWERLLTGSSTATWLIDIAAAHRDPSVDRREPPPPAAPGLLSRRCPPAPDVTTFDTRARDFAELNNRRGTTVLIGPRGVGKSVLALQAVESATRGAGWFLTGSNKQTLISALATAEGFERNLSTAVIAADVDGFARAALGRLHAIAGPWTVVIDNADVDVAELQEFLPRTDHRYRQHLIITTTNRTATSQDARWRDTAAWRPTATTFDVELLDPAEVHAALGAELIGTSVHEMSDDLRLPLVVRAVASLLKQGRTVEAQAVVDSPDPVLRYWEILRTGLLTAAEERTARLAALLPADGAPTAVYALIDPDAPRRLTRLRDLGLLQGHTWSMHRLLGIAVRSDPVHPSAAALTAAALLRHAQAASFLGRNYDADVIAHLRALLTQEKAAQIQAGPALAELAALIDQRGTARDASQVAASALLSLDADSDPDLRAACLLAVVRPMNQHSESIAKEQGREEREAMAEALAQAEEARDIAQRHGNVMLVGKAVAMLGLLTARFAGRFTAGAERLTLLREAQEMVLSARDLRKDAVTEALNESGAEVDEEALRLELAKADFNVGRISIGLAQADPARAREHLVNAQTAYASVGDLRRGVFGTAAHRHIASCVYGEAIADYYTAVLVDTTTEEAMRSLRRASEKATRALEERELLEPDRDAEDTQKSLEILAKITLARLVVMSGSLTGLDGLVTAASDELAALVGRLNVSPDSPTPSP